jgi:hypothetical protein
VHARTRHPRLPRPHPTRRASDHRKGRPQPRQRAVPGSPERLPVAPAEKPSVFGIGQWLSSPKSAGAAGVRQAKWDPLARKTSRPFPARWPNFGFMMLLGLGSRHARHPARPTLCKALRRPGRALHTPGANLSVGGPQRRSCALAGASAFVPLLGVVLPDLLDG